MGPRFDQRGWIFPRSRTTAATARFNGAALRSARMGGGTARARRNSMLLQWGRASISADGEAIARRGPEHESFNGAALRSARMEEDAQAAQRLPERFNGAALRSA